MNSDRFDKIFNEGKEDIIHMFDLEKAKRINKMNDNKCDICNGQLETDGYKWWCPQEHDTTDEVK